MMITKIVSGGQTGVDRAALDVAIKLSIPHGGWCPKDRLAEGGATIPCGYQLKETGSREFSERTKLNIRDSDGTLVLIPSEEFSMIGGTHLTIQQAKAKQKPYLIVDLAKTQSTTTIETWLALHKIKVLNVAGPRESQYPGMYQLSFDFLRELLLCAGKKA